MVKVHFLDLISMPITVFYVYMYVCIFQFDVDE